MLKNIKKLKYIMRKYRGYKILDYSFDLLENRVTINLYASDNLNDIRKIPVIISDVSVLYFINDDTQYRRTINVKTSNTVYDLSSFGVVEKNIKINLIDYDETYLENCCGEANIIIEVYSQIILIEARKITIDDKEYYLY